MKLLQLLKNGLNKNVHIIEQLTKQGTPPKFLPLNTHLLVTMGSQAYGVSTAESDHDIYGFCIPPKGYIFGHLEGYIDGFGHNPLKFEQYQQHGISWNKKEYDFTIYSIVKYFELCRQNNPNMIDSLFVPEDCINFCTKIGRMVLDNRHMFLSKQLWVKYRGYAFSNKHKLLNKNPKEGKRKELVEKYGVDTKYLYNIVRLLNEVEQLLEFGDLDLRRDREMLKAIRKGMMTQDEVLEFFENKTKHLENLYAKSKLPDKPNEKTLRQLLIECLEEHYGDLSAIVAKDNEYKVMVDKIRNIVND